MRWVWWTVLDYLMQWKEVTWLIHVKIYLLLHFLTRTFPHSHILPMAGLLTKIYVAFQYLVHVFFLFSFFFYYFMYYISYHVQYSTMYYSQSLNCSLYNRFLIVVQVHCQEIYSERCLYRIITTKSIWLISKVLKC